MGWIIFCSANSHFVEDSYIKEYGPDFYAVTPTRANARKFANYEQAESVASDLSQAGNSYSFYPEQYNEFTEMNVSK